MPPCPFTAKLICLQLMCKDDLAFRGYLLGALMDLTWCLSRPFVQTEEVLKRYIQYVGEG